MNVRERLYAWRNNEARERGVEGYRVFPNKTLNAIGDALPHTSEELLDVKGVGEVKLMQFGDEILRIVAQEDDAHDGALEHEAEDVPFGVSYMPDMSEESTPAKDKPVTVDAYLSRVNKALLPLRAQITGEVTSIKAQGSAVYFSIQDPDTHAVLQCLMWYSEYARHGLDVQAGDEVVLTGRPDVYKPNGRFSFRAETIEYAGEGALKKAYDKLYKKLEREGLFAPERKRELAPFPKKIGVITSRSGVVIHDFMNNLGRFGYQIRFKDARVEGVAAVRDLQDAIARMREENLDCLALIRGGGSLESLQAFNNEQVVRALADFPAPTICAIGHHTDVPIAQLVADYAPSTPTATTAVLNESWLEVRYELDRHEQLLRRRVDSLHAYGEQLVQRVLSQVDMLRGGLMQMRSALDYASRTLTAHDPMRQLKLGYSITEKEDRIVRSAKDLTAGDRITLRFHDGTKDAEIM